jgi:hypothetical protein
MTKIQVTTKKQKPFWERGYFQHGYWLRKQRIGVVKLGPKGEWDGVYRWEAGTRAGETATLKDAKQAVEQSVSVGASQLPLFE